MDSDAAAEYRECLDKAAFLLGAAVPLQLVETLRWESARGYVLLARHLSRLGASAAALGFACTIDEVARQLQAGAPQGGGSYKVRLLLSVDGTMATSAEPLARRRPAAGQYRVALAAARIDAHEPLLYHKTTWRPWYDGELERHPHCIDVLFCNERDEVTEGTSHNLVVERDGRLVTPPANCGLLPGTLREELLARGILVEAPVSRQELFAARRLWLINSVRGWRRVALTP